MGRKRKSRDSNWSEWMDEKNPAATQWALKYLRKKNLNPRRGHPNDNVQLASVPLPELQSPMAMDRFFDLMKKAWKAKRTRDRASSRGAKALQVYLSQTALDTLKRQSARTQRPMNNILEDLINNTFPSADKTYPAPMLAAPKRTHSSAFYEADLMPETKEQTTQIQEERQLVKGILERIDQLQGEINALQKIVGAPPSPGGDN